MVNEEKGVAVNLKSIYKSDKEQVQLPGITAMAVIPNSMTEGLTPARLGIDFDSEKNCLIEINHNDIEGRNYSAAFKRSSDYNDKFKILMRKEV